MSDRQIPVNAPPLDPGRPLFRLTLMVCRQCSGEGFVTVLVNEAIFAEDQPNPVAALQVTRRITCPVCQGRQFFGPLIFGMKES